MIYGIESNKILEVSGTYEVLGTQDNIIYVSAENLNNPFFQTELPQSLQELQIKLLNEARVKKEVELNLVCDSKLTSFSSSALGDTYYYDSGLEDQLNLIALVVAGIDGYFRCYRKDEPKQNIPHTKKQLEQVFKDGLQYKAQMIAICGALKAYLLTLSDVAEIESVSWEDYQSIKDGAHE